MKKEILNAAPCISHPCDSPGNNPCNNCAFARKSSVDPAHPGLKNVVSAQTYNCKMGGAILQLGDSLFMQVGSKLFPERKPENLQIIEAQERLHTYLGMRA